MASSFFFKSINIRTYFGVRIIKIKIAPLLPSSLYDRLLIIFIDTALCMDSFMKGEGVGQYYFMKKKKGKHINSCIGMVIYPQIFINLRLKSLK